MRIPRIIDNGSNLHTVRLFDIAEFSGYDGPGIRTVVYFQGCGVNCDWCHSPHSQPHVAPLMFNERNCLLCERCLSACPQGVHTFSKGRHLIDRQSCVQCGKCIEACPASVLGVAGSTLHLPTAYTTVESLFQQLLPSLKINGAVTLSGGEALMQPEAAMTLLRLCKQEGIHTAVETSGLLSADIYGMFIPWVDLWLFGVRLVTNKLAMHTEKICQTLELLTGKRAEILPRIPMVPGYFDKDEVVNNLIDILTKYSIHTVWLIPWNEDFDINYYRSGIPLRMEHPTPSEIKRCEKKMILIFQNSKFNIYENKL